MPLYHEHTQLKISKKTSLPDGLFLVPSKKVTSGFGISTEASGADIFQSSRDYWIHKEIQAARNLEHSQWHCANSSVKH
jgi:hypothetical protein